MDGGNYEWNLHATMPFLKIRVKKKKKNVVVL